MSNIVNFQTCEKPRIITRQKLFPAGIYLLKVNDRNTRTRCEICSKLTIKIPERCHHHFTSCSSVSIVNFEHVIAGWVLSRVHKLLLVILFRVIASTTFYCCTWNHYFDQTILKIIICKKSNSMKTITYCKVSIWYHENY